uniref:Integrase catalytic domain-containing protein n=1 Tax=Tanacetum cinerariifolium TaxID=118510 RepID=A0A6L2LB16_TANCI|nr:hypothetical protein [Tanacetum cinerariifolium]GEU57445.1 hypothetical protein [Tanacetum cinerariifolium]
MKKLIAELPTLTTPKKEEELMVYLSAANEAISAILSVERDERQSTIHYVSITLQGAEINYPPVEKLVLALVHAARRLRREENRKADALSKLTAGQCKGLTKGVQIEVLNERSMDTAEVNVIIKEATRTWMPPIQEYIEKKILSEDAIEARTIQEKAHNFTIEEGIQYRKSYLGPLLQCIGLQQAKYIIKEIHMGPCRMHDGPRKAVHKEAKAVTTITRKHVKNFAFDNIVCKFRIRATIITDNETQLINDLFKSWAEGLGIKLVSTSVYHPQANRVVERANRSIMQGIKTRLHQEGGA